MRILANRTAISLAVLFGSCALAMAGAPTAPMFPPGALTNLLGHAVDLSSLTQDDAIRLLGSKMEEFSDLKSKANGITERLAASATNVAKTEGESETAVLKELLKELVQVNQQLQKLQGDVEGILAWVDTQKKSLPQMQSDIAKLKKPGITNYVQFQWSDTQQQSGRTTNDGFQMRRIRFGQKNKIDDKTSMKISFDLATGSNRLSAELRDAQLIYDLEPAGTSPVKQFILGQQPLPLGYEIERSASDREFPERALYNTSLFAGERDRGVQYRHAIGAGSFVHVGLWQGMTVSDPQQSADGFRDADNTIAYSAGIRHKDDNYEVGVAYFHGTRGGFTPTVDPLNPVPEVDRNLVYLDGIVSNFLAPDLTLRGELMFGEDRPPVGGKTDPLYRRQTDVLGYQLQLSYSANARSQFHVRYQMFDPDTTSSPDDAVQGVGFGYTYWVHPGAKVTISYEIFDETGTEIRNNVWTIRSQFKLG